METYHFKAVTFRCTISWNGWQKLILPAILLSWWMLATLACGRNGWASTFTREVEKKTETIYQPLRRAAQNSGQKTFINIRASSLSGETSADTSDGGKYTQSVLAGLRREHAWTSQDGRGWGTKVLTERPPDENTCVFGTSRSEPQTDLVCDYVIHPDGKTTVHFPGSRRDYLTSILN